MATRLRRLRRGAPRPAAEAPRAGADADAGPDATTADLDAMVRADRAQRDVGRERRLVALRHEVGLAVTAAAGAGPTPGRAPVTAATGPPGPLVEIGPDDLDLAALRTGLGRHGCVLVRGLVTPEVAVELAAGVDAALDAFDAAGGRGPGDADGWFHPFRPRPGDYRVGGRRFVRESGALWTADSPRMLARLTELVADTGVGDLVTEHLGERPVLSANKCTLRRVPVDTDTGWHQDGAFLGSEARTLNLWLALSPCGIDAPGLDLVPRRLDHVVPCGTAGATFDWSVGPDEVARAADGVEPVRPTFGPGDALLFDHLLLHSTAVTSTMTRERYAMETWFFAPSAYPQGQIPLAW